MTAAVAVDGRAYEAAAERRDAAAEAERAAFAAWEQAYGAFEVARDECAEEVSPRVWGAARPVARRPAGGPEKPSAGRAPRSTPSLSAERRTVMSVSRRELAVMQSAGWDIQTYTVWDRLRALLGRRSARRRVGRWSA